MDLRAFKIFSDLCFFLFLFLLILASLSNLTGKFRLTNTLTVAAIATLGFYAASYRINEAIRRRNFRKKFWRRVERKKAESQG